MANTVLAAFNEFQKDIVNLNAERTKKARNSRDALLKQIAGFDDFFPLYAEQHIQFGSFARRTKIRPLDDIDMMIAVKAMGCTYSESLLGTIYINVPDDCTTYKSYKHANINTLNSIKVINEFVRKLEDVEYYKQAGIKRNQEAAVLNLISYDWVFDIVPCFYTTADDAGRCYYIIPDGSGNWKKTDPVIDRDRVKIINTSVDGNMLNIIRLVKKWQKRQTMPTVSSYLIECMIINYYEAQNICAKYQDWELAEVFKYISGAILLPVFDPKGIQGDLNTLSNDVRLKIRNKALTDSKLANEAQKADQANDSQRAINKWRQIFGDTFPSYG